MNLQPGEPAENPCVPGSIPGLATIFLELNH